MTIICTHTELPLVFQNFTLISECVIKSRKLDIKDKGQNKQPEKNRDAETLQVTKGKPRVALIRISRK